MIRNDWRIFLLIQLLLGLLSACGNGFEKKEKHPSKNQQAQGHRQEVSINEQYMELMNEFRINNGLRPLQSDPFIEQQSMNHSKAMAFNMRPLGHFGLSARCRRLKLNLGPIKKCGEIVATGVQTPRAVLQAWVNSPYHRSTLTGTNYTHTGLGIHEDSEGRIYWTQIFIEL